MATTAELIQGIIDSKADIITAIESKGSDVPQGAKLADLSAIIDTITTERWNEETVKGLVSGVWPQGVTTFEMPSGITKIKDYAFSDTSYISSFVIPEGVTSIGSYAFYRTQAKRISFPASLKSIGQTCFYGSMINEFIFPDGVDGLTIGMSAFNLGYGARKFYFGEGTKSIGNYAMTNTTGVIDLYIPSTMTSIGTGGLTVVNTSANIIFNKTMAEVQAMANYPWKIAVGCTIHCTDGDIVRS